MTCQAHWKERVKNNLVHRLGERQKSENAACFKTSLFQHITLSVDYFFILTFLDWLKKLILTQDQKVTGGEWELVKTSTHGMRKAPCSTGIAGKSLWTLSLAAGPHHPPSPAPEDGYPPTPRPPKPASLGSEELARCFHLEVIFHESGPNSSSQRGKSQALEAKVGGDQLWFSQQQEEPLPSGRAMAGWGPRVAGGGAAARTGNVELNTWACIG